MLQKIIMFELIQSRIVVMLKIDLKYRFWKAQAELAAQILRKVFLMLFRRKYSISLIAKNKTTRKIVLCIHSIATQVWIASLWGYWTHLNWANVIFCSLKTRLQKSSCNVYERCVTIDCWVTGFIDDIHSTVFSFKFNVIKNIERTSVVDG